MANTIVVKVKVGELTKYGYKDGDKFVGLSKQLSDQDRARIVPGAEFEAEYYVADSGKEYLNKILSVVAPKAESKKESKKFEPTFNKKTEVDNTMSKAEWAAKDRSQLIGGLSHDAAVITAHMVAVDTNLNPLEQYKVLLQGMLEVRDQVH